jgi:hypothetical protein
MKLDSAMVGGVVAATPGTIPVRGADGSLKAAAPAGVGTSAAEGHVVTYNDAGQIEPDALPAGLVAIPLLVTGAQPVRFRAVVAAAGSYLGNATHGALYLDPFDNFKIPNVNDVLDQGNFQVAGSELLAQDKRFLGPELAACTVTGLSAVVSVGLASNSAGIPSTLTRLDVILEIVSPGGVVTALNTKTVQGASLLSNAGTTYALKTYSLAADYGAGYAIPEGYRLAITVKAYISANTNYRYYCSLNASAGNNTAPTTDGFNTSSFALSFA